MSVSQEFDTCDPESEFTLEKWDERHPITFSNAMWSDEEFLAFMKGQVYPKILQSEAIAKALDARLLKTDYGEHGMYFFDAWREELTEEKRFGDDDRYELQMWLMHIAGSWMSSVSKQNMKKSSYDCKNGVEGIIELAFQLRAGANQVWQRDAELVLPDEPDAVIADSIAAMPLPEFWQRVLARSDTAYPLSWSYSNLPESVITFAFIASKDDSDLAATLSRLQMCFYSAQKHRRALCCPDAPVFGGTLHDGMLQFYVSFWEGNTLAIQRLFGRYALSFFNDFVECYFILCRLAEYTSEFLLQQFEQWNADRYNFKEKVERASNRPWRRENRSDVEPDVCFEAEGNQGGSNGMTGMSVAGIKQIGDRKTRLLLGSVRQQQYYPEKGYPLTRKNKRTFDFITKADESEDVHTAFSPSVWVKETYLYRGEYEDPAPFSPEDGEEQGTHDDLPVDVQPDVDSGNGELAPDGGALLGAISLPEVAKGAKIQDSGPLHNVLILQPDDLGVSSTTFPIRHSFEDHVTFLDCMGIRVC